MGAKRPTVEGIVEHALTVAEDNALAQKGYEDIGGTEISLLRSGFTDQPKENLDILAGLYETHPWVFICTQYIATTLAAIPLRIMEATGFEDGLEVVKGADESPVGEMFRYINPAQSPYDFVEALTSWLLLTGEAYIAYTDPSGDPDAPPNLEAEMWILFTPFVQKVVSPRLGLVGYEYNVGGEVAYFDERDVVHFKTWSPAGRWRGQGVPVAGIKTLQTDAELREFNRRVLAQGVHLSGVLETDNEDLGKENATQIRKTFEQQYAGSKKAAKVAVLWGGLKFNPTTILQKDIMLTEQSKDHRDEIIAGYGLKPELLSEKFSNKATAETVTRMAIEGTVLGRWGHRIISTLNASGLRRFGTQYRATFDTRNVPALQTSLKEKLDAGAVAIATGQMTPNEVRVTIHNLEPLGSELDIPLIGGTPVDQLVAEPEPAPEPNFPPKPGGGDPADAGDEGPGKRKPKKPGANGAAKGLAGTTRSIVIVSAHERASIESKVGTEFAIQFERNQRLAEIRLKRAILSVYRELAQELRPLVSRSTTYSQVLAEVEKLFLFDGRKEISSQFTEVMRGTIEDAVQSELARLGLRGSLNVKPVRALKRLGQQEQRIRNMWGRDWVKLRRGLTDGLAQGFSEAKLTQGVDGFFEGRRNNALTIARTETTPAVNGAYQDVALQAIKAGTDIVSIWATNKDEKVRQPPRDSKNHAEAEGLTIVPGQEMFVVSGQRMEFPGDSWNGASPDNTIGCRCGVRNEVRKPAPDDNRLVVA